MPEVTLVLGLLVAVTGATGRASVGGLRDRGVINDEVLHRIQRELDLEEVRLLRAETAEA